MRSCGAQAKGNERHTKTETGEFNGWASQWAMLLSGACWCVLFRRACTKTTTERERLAAGTGANVRVAHGTPAYERVVAASSHGVSPSPDLRESQIYLRSPPCRRESLMTEVSSSLNVIETLPVKLQVDARTPPSSQASLSTSPIAWKHSAGLVTARKNLGGASTTAIARGGNRPVAPGCPLLQYLGSPFATRS